MQSKVLIVGGRATKIAARLQTAGYSCATALTLVNLRSESLPSAVVIAATGTKAASSAIKAVKRIRKWQGLPLLLDGTDGEVGAEGKEVDSVAHNPQEMEKLLEASLKGPRQTSTEAFLRGRLDLLLGLSQAITHGASQVELAELVASRLADLLQCDDVSVLQVAENQADEAWLINARGQQFPIDLTVNPNLRRSLEVRAYVAEDGSALFPLDPEGDGLRSIQIKRRAALDQEEVEFVGALGLQLAAAAERDRTRAAVDRARASLEDAYLDKYRDLVEGNARLKAIDQRTNALVTVLSHDLRSPLNVLLGHAHLLVTDEGLPEQARKSADVIQRTSRKILGFVETQLEANRGHEQIVLFMRTLDIAELCHETVREFQILAGERGLALVADAPSPLFVNGDELKLRQVVQNLVTNAMHHANGATQVVVSAYLKSRPEGQVVQVDVCDNGSVEDATSLLLAFESGSGLGLPICREYVERHGGEIWIEARKGRGAEFSFTLPVGGGMDTVSRETRTWPRQTATVLLCSNDPVSIRAATLGLASQYRVETVRDGLAAFQRAKDLAPDIIVMDIFMPKRDGLATLRELKADASTSLIPVLLVSSDSEIGVRVRSLNLGVEGHVTKPFEPETLLQLVGRALQSSEFASGRRMAGVDLETGFLDYPGLVRRLQQELSRSMRYNRPLTLAALRPTAALQGVPLQSCAEALRKALRTVDIVGHLGEGVFVIALPETDLTNATTFARRLGERALGEGFGFTSKVADVGELGQIAERALEKVMT